MPSASQLLGFGVSGEGLVNHQGFVQMTRVDYGRTNRCSLLEEPNIPFDPGDGEGGGEL